MRGGREVKGMTTVVEELGGLPGEPRIHPKMG